MNFYVKTLSSLLAKGLLRIEDSVRQSSYFGFHRIKQIVLECPLGGEQEIAWIFTLDENRPGNPRGNPRRRR